jgi:superfamily II DNA or RNA helicase
LIADEAHNLGSPSVLKVLPQVHLHKRIGLSATPKRIYDLEGTTELEAFFKDKEPYVFNFSVEEAIEQGFLCQYKYYPHLVALNDDEFERYADLSQKLLNFFDHKTGNYKDSDAAFRLLLARKRIIQKAESKLPKVREILEKRFEQKRNLKYAFVFVPEGIGENESDTTDDSTEDLRLIEHYVQTIANIHPSVVADSFTSKTPNREETLRYFEKGIVHVLASMKCLDEGVDIPRTELAVFCASTGNPRQFIQRRGRILRQHKDKHLAEIHDLVVVPFLGRNHRDDTTFLMEKSLVRKELERVVHFAFLSLNPYESIEALREVCDYYELELFAIQEQIKNSSA